MKKILLTAITLWLLSGTVLSQELFVKRGSFSAFEPIPLRPLQPIDVATTVGDYPVLKLGPELKIALAKVFYSTGAVVPLGRVVAFGDRDKKLHVVLDMSANLEVGNGSDWTDEPCKRVDYLWKRSTGGMFRDVNCVSINHIVTYFVAPTGDFQQIQRGLRDDGIEIPPTVVRVSFTRYAGSSRRLVYVVDVNPEIYGIDRDSSTVWGASAWHKSVISRDPKKVEFVERLGRWATDVQDRMDRAFKGDWKAFDNVGPIDSYLRPR